MLTASQLAVIKQTVPVLQEGGEALTRHFYERMFRENPEVLRFFNPAHQKAGTQQRALAGAVLAYAQNIETPEALASAVELIAQKHASLGIQAEHYPIVGANLLASIQEVLGEAATPAVIDAWGAAYGVLADIFIHREKQIYDHHQQDYGWTGFKRFVVKRAVTESDTIRSLYLAPEDGMSLRPHLPGQYITVRVAPQAGGEPIMRNYSLSNRPGADQYRISVKHERTREAGAPDGVCSSFIHQQLVEGDVVELAPPCGEFTLDTGDNRALVLIAGGVGITPLLSMLYAALEANPNREVLLVQCVLNSAVRPFANELAQLQGDFPHLRVHVRYSDPLPEDSVQQGVSHGLLDSALLDSLVGEQAPAFYLCGPAPMLRQGWQLLAGRGVASEDIRFEFFGPATDITA